MSSPRVLITCRQMQNCIDDFRERFDERGIEIVMPEVVQQPTEEELMALIGEFDGMIAGDDPLSARVLERAERLRIISKWGVGTDGIDKDAARRLGITVRNTPGVFGEEVGDVAAGYVVMLVRQLHRIDASVRSGGWWKHEGRTLSGMGAGVAGFGTIGQATARRLLAFGMSVVAHDPAQEARDSADRMGVRLVELDELFRESEVLVLCCPLTPETFHMVDARSLALLPPGSHVVNVGRGPLVDEPALVDALRSGHVWGAALDVFEDEPLPANSPLRDFDRCVFGSHNGSNTREGVLRASALAVDNVLAGLEAT